MKQAYEAVDKIDGVACYFFFDGVGGYTALTKSIAGSKKKCSELF